MRLRGEISRLFVPLTLLVLPAAHAEPPTTISDFALIDHHGQPWSWQQTRGKVALIAFGYTSCPDVCPLTLNVVAQALKKLGAKAERVAPLLISVDTARDKPETLREYIEYFDPRITGLTGTPEQIAAAASRFNVGFKVAPPTSGGGYTVDHTANLFVVGTDGAITAIVPFGFPVEHVAGLVDAELTR